MLCGTQAKMNDTNIRKALITGAEEFLTAAASLDTAKGTVDNLPTLPEDSIGWENRTFDPSGKDPWASVFYRPNLPEGRTIGQGGYDQITGFIQIDLNIAPGQGEKPLIDWEEKARIYFHPGRFFVNGGQSVLVVSSGMSEGRHVENFYRKSITVSFRGHLKRNEVI